MDFSAAGVRSAFGRTKVEAVDEVDAALLAVLIEDAVLKLRSAVLVTSCKIC